MSKKKIVCISAAIAIFAIIAIVIWQFANAGSKEAKIVITKPKEPEPVIDSSNFIEDVEDYEKLREAGLDSLKIFFDKLRNDYIQKIDFEQDLSSLSMKDLMLLRSSIYAINGLYFKDENLHSYFTNKKNSIIPWYKNYMCFLLELELEKDKNKPYYEYINERILIENEKDVKLNDSEKQFVKRLDERIAELRKNDMYISKNGYTIGNAAHIVNMHKIKNLNEKYMNKLTQNNFVIVDSSHLQLFYLYEQNNYDKMPSFVTTDLFLQAFHIYLSYMLKKLEQTEFMPALKDLTLSLYEASMNLTKSEDSEIMQMAEYNAAFYAISHTLLTGKKLKVPEKYQNSYNEEVSKATAAALDGEESKFLDGEIMHYTLFKPRGHYTRKPEMQAYFKAMMWLQKAYFCRDKTSHLKQSIFMANLLNTEKTAKNKPLLNVYASIFEPTALLVGEPNNLSIMDIAQFLKSENIEDIHAALSAENIEKADNMLSALSERIIIKPKLLATCPDKINFMPQRYLIDNEVLQEMADTSSNANRAFPKGLDVFSAFGSASASDVLNNFYKEEEKWSKYPEEMAKLQKKFSNFDGWNKSVYNKWIEGLLALQKRDKSYPAFMKTKAWDYKNLNTSLASWAELKHDFTLYADQPGVSEGGDGGVYLPEPDAEVGYVEPNILFWNKLSELITLTHSTLAKHKWSFSSLNTLRDFVNFLIGVSKKELAKKPLSAEEYKRIKDIGSVIENFTLDLFELDSLPGYYNTRSWGQVRGPERSIAVVADIYAHPAKGILHVATGKANEIYVVVEINGYLYLTRGATFSYYEFVMPGTRLTDEEWQEMEGDISKCPAIPEWMQSIIVYGDPRLNAAPTDHYFFCFY